MARKRKSILIDLLNIATNISWKISLPIAVITYFIFHHYATMNVMPGTDAHSAIQAMPMNLFITFSKYLQYIIPIVFVIGAITSVLKAGQRRKLLEQQTGLETIREMSWQKFELLVGEAYRRQGYIVRENGGGGADGGIDLFLSKDGRRTVVQCKRWKTSTVSVSLVRELFGVMNGVKADACVFVTSGKYTREAEIFAQGKPIELIDGEALFQMITSVQSIVKDTKLDNKNPLIKDLVSDSPICPVCAGPMLRRVAKKGLNAGNHFFGCAKYPACRGTLP